MGSVRLGAPEDIIELLSNSYGVSTFIETGTYLGDTAAWASKRFDRVITIEGSPEIQRSALEKHGHNRNITFVLGNSRDVLEKALADVDDLSIIWLDAHWMPGAFGAEAECPIIAEIEAINRSSHEHFILIDDARLFLAPPPKPHRAADWPDLATVLATLNELPNRPRFEVIYEDVIVAVPEFSRELVRNFYQRLTTERLESAATHTLGPLSKFLRRAKGFVRHRLSTQRG
jgi:hypothetical protein